MTLGIDFDGVLRKFPLPFVWFFNFISPNDLLIHARLKWLRDFIRFLIQTHCPFVLDGELIREVHRHNEKRILLVSGRCQPKDKLEAILAVAPYLDLQGAYFKEDCDEFEEKFKERIIKNENITIFIEDRRFVRSYLKKDLSLLVFSPKEFKCRGDS